MAIDVYVAPTAKLLGEVRLGSGVKIFDWVIIGFPSRRTLRAGGGAGVKMVEIGEGSVIRSHTVIYEDVVIGRGVETGHFVLIREGSRVGDSVTLGTGSMLDGRVIVGDNTSIQSGVYLPMGTVVGKNVFLGPMVCVTNDLYPPSSRLLGVVIEDDVVVGANTTLISGVRLGRGAVVGAGSVVTRDVPPYTVVYGSPAKPVYGREAYELKKMIYESRGMGGTKGL